MKAREKRIHVSFRGYISSVQFSSVAQSCLTLCNPMNCSTPGLPVHHQLPEFTQTYVHQISDAIQPAHPLSSPSPPAPNPSQHQSLFQCVNSSHEVARVPEFHISFRLILLDSCRGQPTVAVIHFSSYHSAICTVSQTNTSG